MYSVVCVSYFNFVMFGIETLLTITALSAIILYIYVCETIPIKKVVKDIILYINSLSNNGTCYHGGALLGTL